MTPEQQAALINAHREASQLLADTRLAIHRRDHHKGTTGQDDPGMVEEEQRLRREFNEADRAFMDLVISL